MCYFTHATQSFAFNREENIMHDKPTILEMIGGALGALIMWAFFYFLLSF
jgi:hypothetical protein